MNKMPAWNCKKKKKKTQETLKYQPTTTNRFIGPILSIDEHSFREQPAHRMADENDRPPAQACFQKLFSETIGSNLE